jgi:hypothetical protein
MAQITLTWLGTTYFPPYLFIIGWEAPGSALPMGSCRSEKHLKKKSTALSAAGLHLHPTMLSLYFLS